MLTSQYGQNCRGIGRVPHQVLIWPQKPLFLGGEALKTHVLSELEDYEVRKE